MRHRRETWQDLLRIQEPSRWVTYSGDYTGQRHSPSRRSHRPTRIASPQNGRFRPASSGAGFEGTPSLSTTCLYVPGPFNNAWALDARTGRRSGITAAAANDLTYGATSPVNRGFGSPRRSPVHADRDAHLLALDTRSGSVVWDA